MSFSLMLFTLKQILADETRAQVIYQFVVLLLNVLPILRCMTNVETALQHELMTWTHQMCELLLSIKATDGHEVKLVKASDLVWQVNYSFPALLLWIPQLLSETQCRDYLVFQNNTVNILIYLFTTHSLTVCQTISTPEFSSFNKYVGGTGG